MSEDIKKLALEIVNLCAIGELLLISGRYI
jgi:hypothetical protein